MRHTLATSILLTAVALSGCDLFGESGEKAAAAREAEGKAIGGACRHAGRAIEDCYSLNKKADKAAVFAGWRDMNDYMRENKIEAVQPTLLAAKTETKAEAKEAKATKGEAKGEKAATAVEGGDAPAEKKPAEKKAKAEAKHE